MLKKANQISEIKIGGQSLFGKLLFRKIIRSEI
jgi:hypothetical protein